MQTPFLYRLMIHMVIFTTVALNAKANYVLNGSFEAATTQGTGDILACEIGQARYTAAGGHNSGTFQTALVTSWAASSIRIWYMTDLGSSVTAVFPEGDYAARLDARADVDGVEVLSQSGLSLLAGKSYRFSVSTWGEIGTTFITARLVGPGLPTVTIYNQKPIDGADGRVDRLAARFDITVSGNYTLEITGPSSGSENNHLWIDDVSIIDALPFLNILDNPGFEFAAIQNAGGLVNSELGNANFTSAGSGSGTFSLSNVTSWGATGDRLWYMTDLGSAATADFPGGNFAACLDGRADLGGTEILYQDRIELLGGGRYKFSLDTWGGGLPLAYLNARLTSPGISTVSLFTNQPITANDGLVERNSVEFSVATTGLYRLEITAVDSGAANNPTWIDNLELVQVLPGVTVLQGVGVAGGGIQILAGNTLPGVEYTLQRAVTFGENWTNTTSSVASSTELLFNDPAGEPRLIYRVVSETP